MKTCFMVGGQKIPFVFWIADISDTFIRLQLIMTARCGAILNLFAFTPVMMANLTVLIEMKTVREVY